MNLQTKVELILSVLENLQIFESTISVVDEVNDQANRLIIFFRDDELGASGNGNWKRQKLSETNDQF